MVGLGATGPGPGGAHALLPRPGGGKKLAARAGLRGCLHMTKEEPFMDYSKLKSGTDIRGVAVEGRRRAGNAHRRSGGNHRGGLFGVGPAPSGQGCLCLENRHWPRLPRFRGPHQRRLAAGICAVRRTGFGLRVGLHALHVLGNPGFALRLLGADYRQPPPLSPQRPKILHPPGWAGRPGYHGNPGPGPRGRPARSGRLPAPWSPAAT